MALTWLRKAAITLLLILSSGTLRAQESGLLAWWKFDGGAGNVALDSVSGGKDAILNHFAWEPGVSGTALKFDGFTSFVSREDRATPHFDGSFTVEAWIALQSYPVNWVAIIDQEKEQKAGYFLGVDSRGRLGLQVEVWADWQQCLSTENLPLERWNHVVGTYDTHSGMKLYINGRLAGQLSLTGSLTPAEDTGLRIGRSFKELPPDSLVRPFVSFPASYSVDGLIDEVKIYGRALTADDVAHALAETQAPRPPVFSPRRWPTLETGQQRFEAVYTRLKLYPEWDALWRSGPYSDVVVNFGDAPYHLAFWRGTNFEENLVTENNIWMGDQSFESGTKCGCAEHMSDKKNLHGWVSIIENTAARVVLHWRYGLVDVTGEFSNVDPLTGWGDWADEYFYIYPDGVAVRYGTVHGTAREYSFTEPTVLIEPGKKAEDYINLDAVTISNPEGHSRTYSWDPASPPFPFPDQPAGANIAVVNLKSDYKPFYIYQPGTILGPYGNPPEARLQYSRFPTWNHWPVNQAPTDGRYALVPDRYSSAAVMSPDPNGAWINGPEPTKSTYFLFGLTKQSASALAALDRSWLQAPVLRISSGSFTNAGYSRSQRAYLIAREGEPEGAALNFTLDASDRSPVVNPAFVIQGWGDSQANLTINSKAVEQGPDFHTGYVHRLEGTDLVVWFRYDSNQPVEFSLSSLKSTTRRSQPRRSS
jgi:hypothetical protein